MPFCLSTYLCGSPCNKLLIFSWLLHYNLCTQKREIQRCSSIQRWILFRQSSSVCPNGNCATSGILKFPPEHETVTVKCLCVFLFLIIDSQLLYFLQPMHFYLSCCSAGQHCSKWQLSLACFSVALNSGCWVFPCGFQMALCKQQFVGSLKAASP